MLFRSKKISKAFAWAQMTRGRMRSKSESISRSDGQSCQPQCSTNGRWYSTHGDPGWPGKLAWTMDCIDEVSLKSVVRPCLPL